MREVGLEVNADLGDELGGTSHGNAEHLSNCAAAVGGDEVFRPNGLDLLGVDIADRRCDAVGVLSKFHKLAREANARGAALLGMRLDERFEADLRQVGGVGRRRLQIMNDARRAMAAERAHFEQRLAGQRIVAA